MTRTDDSDGSESGERPRAGGMAEPVVRRAESADVAPMVETLARAFDDDPVPRFLFRGDWRRRRGLRTFFRIQLRHTYLEHGEVWTTTDVAGVAMSAPPGKPRPRWSDLAHMVQVLPYLTGLGRRAPDALRLLAAVDRARPRQPHWYLATLGTDPDRQGHGVGSALLRAVLGRVDEVGLPAYLESSKERNIAFYARHGFEVTGEIHTPHDGPTLWLMWREPKPPGG